METFAILRRNGWTSPAELEAAAARSAGEGAGMPDVRWIRTYAFVEPDGTLGAVCIYQATGVDAVRRHSAAAELPATEVLPVANTLVVNPDPEMTSAG